MPNLDQIDSDSDGGGDACDACPLDPANDVVGDATVVYDASMEGYYQDQFYTRIFNTPDDKLEEWAQWNASVTLHSTDDDWYLEAWGRNLTDEDNFTGQYLQDASIGLYRTYQLLEPRTYGLTAGYRF